MAKKVAKTKTVKKKTTATKTAKKTAKAAAADGDKAEVDGEEAPVKKKKAKRKARVKKADIEIRQVLYWGIFNHAMKPVAKYAFNQKKAAEKKAKELSPEGKFPHFVNKLKEPIEEV